MKSLVQFIMECVGMSVAQAERMVEEVADMACCLNRPRMTIALNGAVEAHKKAKDLEREAIDHASKGDEALAHAARKKAAGQACRAWRWYIVASRTYKPDVRPSEGCNTFDKAASLLTL